MTVRGYVDMKNRERYILEFTTPEEIYFPKNCLICGKKTSEIIQKNLFGSFISGKDYKIDYTANFPICSSCKKRIAMKTGLKSKSGKILCSSIVLSIPIALILSFLFKAYFFSLSIVLIAIILPFINHRTKMKPKLKAAEFLEFGFEPLDQGKVKVILKNNEYAKIVEEINKAKVNEIREDLNIKNISKDSEQLISETEEEAHHVIDFDAKAEESNETIESNRIQTINDTSIVETNKSKMDEIKEDSNIKKISKDSEQLISESEEEALYVIDIDAKVEESNEKIESDQFQTIDYMNVEEINKAKINGIREDDGIREEDFTINHSEESEQSISVFEEEMHNEKSGDPAVEKGNENGESDQIQSTDDPNV